MIRSQLILWVLRAQAGDRAALDTILREVEAELFGLVQRVLGDEALAVDVLQDVLILVVRKVRHLADPAAFGAWARTIARREAVRAAKRRSRDRSRLAPLDDATAVGGPTGRRAYEAVLAQAMESVPPAARQVLSLHYEEDLTLAEVAARLAVPIGTVKSRLAYGLDSFRKTLTRLELTQEDVW
jgi:RNA polymerase sigma-70 factor (ECF subfamily)